MTFKTLSLLVASFLLRRRQAACSSSSFCPSAAALLLFSHLFSSLHFASLLSSPLLFASPCLTIKEVAVKLPLAGTALCQHPRLLLLLLGPMAAASTTNTVLLFNYIAVDTFIWRTPRLVFRACCTREKASAMGEKQKRSVWAFKRFPYDLQISFSWHSFGPFTPLKVGFWPLRTKRPESPELLPAAFNTKSVADFFFTPLR